MSHGAFEVDIEEITFLQRFGAFFARVFHKQKERCREVAPLGEIPTLP